MDLEAARQAYIAMMTLGTPPPEDVIWALADDMVRQREAGIQPAAIELPEMDEAARRSALLGRLRLQATRAATQTVYYREVFARIGLDPERMTLDDVPRIPITPKAHLRDRTGDFVASGARPLFQSFTGGTTGGRPIGLWWSRRELMFTTATTIIAHSAMAQAELDVVMDIGDSTQFLSMFTNGQQSQRTGEPTIWGRMHDPAATVDQLMEPVRIGSRLMRPSAAGCFPSYWGAVVGAARALGCSPSDFEFRTLGLGGEIVTGGLVRRSREVFGELQVFDFYGASELWGSGGGLSCGGNHTHFGAGAVYNGADLTQATFKN